MFIRFTYVDVVTKVPMSESPCIHGTSIPDISGIKSDFGNESQWPSRDAPIFYGTCDDDVDADSFKEFGCFQVTEEEYVTAKKEEFSRRRKISISRTKKKIQSRLEDFAVSGGFDSILEATTYATSSNKESAIKGQLAIDLRDATWNKFKEICSSDPEGVIQYSSIEPSLPELKWDIENKMNNVILNFLRFQNSIVFIEGNVFTLLMLVLLKSARYENTVIIYTVLAILILVSIFSAVFLSVKFNRFRFADRYVSCNKVAMFLIGAIVSVLSFTAGTLKM